MHVPHAFVPGGEGKDSASVQLCLTGESLFPLKLLHSESKYLPSFLNYAEDA